MTKQQKLEAIYEAMADAVEVYQGPDSAPAIDILPVRIGDVFDWFDMNNPNHLWGGNGVINGEIIIRHWNHLRLPIDDQEEECIDFVYSLIFK